MKTNIVICVLIGVPGAGKTTLAKKLVNMALQGSNCELNIIKLSFDDFVSVEDQEKIVLDTKSRLDSKAFKDIRANFVECVSSTICALKAGKDLDKSSPLYLGNVLPTKYEKYALIVDDNFYYKSMRYKFFQMASNFNCGFCQVYLECSQVLAEERNRNRPEKVSFDVIQTMCYKLEPPCFSNSWETESVVAQAQELDSRLQQIYDLINQNFEKGLSTPEDDSLEKKKAQVINMTSLLHRTDLVLRALVGVKMKTLKALYTRKATLKDASTVVNSVRQDLLTRLGNKTLLVPSAVFETAPEMNSLELQKFLEREFESCCTIYNI